MKKLSNRTSKQQIIDVYRVLLDEGLIEKNGPAHRRMIDLMARKRNIEWSSSQ